MYKTLSIQPLDLSWLAGLLEGEGSFMKPSPSSKNRPILHLAMADEDVVQRASALMGGSYRVRNMYRENRPDSARWKPSFTTRVTGRRAVEVMVAVYTLMGSRRREQIRAALAAWEPSPRARKLTRAQAHEIVRRSRRGERAADLAGEFGVSKPSIYAVRQGRFFAEEDTALVDLRAVVAQVVRAPS